MAAQLKMPVTQNQVWASDTNQFGYRMLESMGWTEGKGLGKDEQGDSTHVSVMKKTGKDGIGAKRDGTGNTTLTSGLLEFHRILQRLGETHKEGSPAVALPEPAAAPPVAARPDAAKVARAAKAGAAKVPPSTAAAGGPPSEKAMLKAMRVAARRVGGEASRKAAKKVAKKRSREEAAGLGSAKRMRGAGGVDATVLEAAARVRQSYRRAIRTKNIRGYSKHDMGAILLDARGAFRAPTAVERATSNAATKLGEGLDSHSAAAAAAVLKRHGPR